LLKSSEDVLFAEDLNCSGEEEANTAKHNERDERQRSLKIEFVDVLRTDSLHIFFFD
jgi:hypothetical protein